MRAAPEGSAHHTQRWHNRRDRCAGARPCPCRFDACAAQGGEARERAKSPPSRSTEKSWPHFRPSAVDFCGSRLAIGAATERARALAMPPGTRAQALQTRKETALALDRKKL